MDPDRVLRVISDGAPDIVALQDVDASPEGHQISHLSERLGMRFYGSRRTGANAFLSHYPLRGIQDFSLGEGGCCLRADADIKGKRLHLLNLRLESSPGLRRRQIAALLGPQLLGNPSLMCPTVVLGDFADLWWGAGNMNLSLALRKVRRPVLSGTYPASFPLCGRDRAYIRGSIRILETSVERSETAREASSHLPFNLTLQILDTQKFLPVNKIGRNRMEIAPG